MKKRIISMLLVLCMVLAFIPAGITNVQASGTQSQQFAEENKELSQDSAKKDNTTTQEPAGTGSIITRAQWVQTLVEAFDMTVEEAHAPDNYFSDLTGDEDYYRDILVAVQFGVVDIPAGEAFRPNDAATREFAAQTLNSCLGFLRNEDEGYTFSEASAVTYPDDVQISIDRGWFALSEGSFLPQQAITEAEEKVMLADIEQTLAARVIDTDYKNSYTFSTDVIEIPQGTDVEVVQETVTIRNNPETIKNGDVFVVWYNGVPCAYIANRVTKSGDTTTIDVTAVEDDSAIVSADAQGVLDTEFVQFVPAEGTEVVYVDEVTGEEYTDARQADAAIASHNAKRGTKKLMTIQLKSEIDLGSGLSASVSVKLKDPVLEYKISSKSKTAYVTLTADYEFSISAKAELIENAAVKKLRLGFWGCPGIGGIELAMVYSLAGSVTGTHTGTMCVGADYTSGAGFSIPKSFHSKGFSLVIEASLKAGLQVNLGINDIPGDLLSGYVYVEVGAKGSFKRTSYSDNTAPKTCVQTAMYLYLECGAKLTFKVGTYKSEYSREYKIWKDSNSPVRVVHHYEDGKEVCQCSRGNVYDNGYYTVGTSNYWGSGWSGGSGGSGYDKYGNPVPVYTYTVDEEGNATITGYNGGGASVVIPSTLDGNTVTAIGFSVFRDNTAITSVQFADTITSIGNSAFAGCTNLSNVELPEHLSALGSHAFFGCTNIKSIEIPKSLEEASAPFYESGLEKATFEAGTTSVVSRLFDGAKLLKSVTLLDTMTSIEWIAFRNCTNLTSIDLPNSITSIGSSAFADCTNLSNVELPERLSALGSHAFFGCTNIKSIEIPKSLEEASAPFYESGLEKATFEAGTTSVVSGLFDGAKLLKSVTLLDTMTSIEWIAFRDCTNLTSIDLPNSITSIGSSAFAGCTNLSNVELPERLSALGSHAFFGCTNIKSIEIPKSLEEASAPFYESGLEKATFEAGTTSIVSGLFDGAKLLKSVTLLDTMTSIEWIAFRDCTNLTSIDLPNSITSIGSSAFAGCTNLSNVELPERLSALGSHAFFGCTNIKSIEIPKSLEEASAPFYESGLEKATFEAGTTSVVSGLFDGAKLLKSVTLLDTMTSIEWIAFRDCTNLTSIDLPNSITYIGNSAFAGCTSLNKIAIPDTTTSMGDYTFSDCTSLVEVKLPNCRKNITEGMFKNCSSLTKITLPETVTAIRSNAFNGCSSLTHITIPSGVETIESSAFENCTSLESITIPDGTKAIGSEAFQNCTALTSANLGDGVTSIGSYLFDGCSMLKEVKLGSGLTKIPERAFSNCGALESIMIPYRVEEIGANAFLNDVKLTSVTIPRRTAKIALNAFSYPEKLTIYGVAGTYAETYAGEIGAKFVAIDKPATGVTLNETAVRMNKGATIQLVATVTPVDFTDETAWKSSDTSIATVTDAGVVKAVGIGECTVSFVAGNVKAACKITVVQPVTSISLNKTSLSLDAGETFTLTASVSPNNAENKEITWSSSDETIATVDENGLVTALKKGTATITATANDGSGVQKSCAVTVKGNLYIVSNVADLQSPHPYTVNCNDIWQYSVPGATQLNLTFSADTAVESGSDYIYIYSADGTLVGKYTGIELAGKTIAVPGGTVRIKLVSDGTYCEYGFAVTSVTTQSEPHTHNYTSVVTSPTCTEQGYTTHTCTVCGDSYRDTYTAALGHAWDNGKVTTQPTETTEGVKTFTCTRCGVTRTESIPATGNKPCDGGENCPSGKFVDVNPKEWYHPYVDYAVTHGLFGGTSANTFEPETAMTRAMLVTVLWRYEGKPMGYQNTFSDVNAKNGSWYIDAVAWAAANGIVGGVGNNKFDPDGNITREQMATILFRYAKKKGIDTSKRGDLSGFPDGSKVESWAKDAVQWTVAEGIIGGSDGKLLPQGSATRAQVATILMRFIENTI